MIHLLVEDKIDKFPYKLLSRTLDNNLQGAGGNGRVSRVLSKTSERPLIVFVDTLPDNDRSQDAYNKAVIFSNENTNVYVIPIPCIEYFFIKEFIGPVTTETKTVLNFGNYKEHHYSDTGGKLVTKNFEKFCKSVIEKYSSCYNKRIFENTDCFCNDGYKSERCAELLLSEKCERFLSAIPYKQTECGLLDFMREKYISHMKLYNEMKNNFTQYGIASTIKLETPNWF